VVGVTEKDIEDIYVIRMRIEDLAVRWAAESMTDEDCKALWEVVELQEFYAQKEDAERLCEMDGTFHEAIYRFSRSKPLRPLDFLQILRPRQGVGRGAPRDCSGPF